MRVAVISDTHFGDPLGTLVTSNRGATPCIGPAYDPFAAAVGEVDYLVLLGDIVDFSVASYEEAYRDARTFFERVHRDGLARELIYLPGNHDYDIWHTVEHQVNVINRLEQGQLPRAFKRSVPGVLDDRRADAGLVLPDVVPGRGWDDPGPHYGNLFLDEIIRDIGFPQSSERLTFNFAYPNLYLVTDDGECLLLTHGHYFEAFWSIASEMVTLLAMDDLELEGSDGLSLREMVGINLPLNQLACTGIGQAHPLAQLARRLQNDVAAGRLDEVTKYFDRFENVIRGATTMGPIQRLGATFLTRLVKRVLRSALEHIEQARYSREFLSRPSVRERFRQYYRYTLHELERLGREHDLNIPVPTHVVFGHTHQPIPWGAEELVDVVDGNRVRFCNTGGWVLKDDRSGLSFVGAEVLVYESGKSVRSVPVRDSDVYPVEPVGTPVRTFTKT